MIDDSELIRLAEYTLERFRVAELKIATAESCTGGLIAALITSIPGSSAVFDRGFVTYSNQAKNEALDVPDDVLEAHGAVSAETAISMTFGALAHSRADISLAVTGIAGPDGGSKEKPVGMVFIAMAMRDSDQVFVEELELGDIGRGAIRQHTVRAAIEMLLNFGLADEEEDELGVFSEGAKKSSSLH